VRSWIIAHNVGKRLATGANNIDSIEIQNAVAGTVDNNVSINTAPIRGYHSGGRHLLQTGCHQLDIVAVQGRVEII
jgi:hypothetical protein